MATSSMVTYPDSDDHGHEVELVPLHPPDPPDQSAPMRTYEPPPDGSEKPKISLQQV